VPKKKHQVIASTELPVLAPTGDVHPNVLLTPEALRFILSQVAGKSAQESVASSPNLKYAFEYFKLGSELMNIFGNLQLRPFTKKTVRDTPGFGGVYLIFRAGALLYVGISDRLRRRLSEHLRGASNFALAVKSKYKPNDYKKFVAENFHIHMQEFEDPGYRQQLEHVIIGVFRPSFNQE